MIIAIDGPAASGKSTTAKKAAKRLGFFYLDTGAMYRAVTLSVLEQGIDISDPVAVKSLLEKTAIDLKDTNGNLKVLLNGKDVSKSIRSSGVTGNVSAVSAVPAVRKAMVRLQRQLALKRNCVVEGRDIGTVVFPDADLKFFIEADPETRARRRQKDLRELGETTALDDLVKEIIERDRKDSTREDSPLVKAEDAIVIDTSNLSVDEQVAVIVNAVQNENKGR